LAVTFDRSGVAEVVIVGEASILLGKMEASQIRWTLGGTVGISQVFDGSKFVRLPKDLFLFEMVETQHWIPDSGKPRESGILQGLGSPAPIHLTYANSFALRPNLLDRPACI